MYIIEDYTKHDESIYIARVRARRRDGLLSLCRGFWAKGLFSVSGLKGWFERGEMKCSAADSRKHTRLDEDVCDHNYGMSTS